MSKVFSAFDGAVRPDGVVVPDLTQFAEMIDGFGDYIVQWAIRKNFRESCENCAGIGVEAHPDGRGANICPHCNGSCCQPESRNFGEQIALIHSEISELHEKFNHDAHTHPDLLASLMAMHQKLSHILENHRRQKPGTPPVMDEHCPEFTNSEIELADIFIRMADLASANRMRLGAAIKAKQAYNETRPPKHGKRY